MTEQQFDAFLAHNSLDKQSVEKIAEKLRAKNFKPWLDKEQIKGGDSIPKKVAEGIVQSLTAIFFIGLKGFGKFQEVLELDALIMLCYQKNLRIIPVMLPGVNQLPDELILLASRRYIKFEQSIDEESPINELFQALELLRPNAKASSPSVETDAEKIEDLKLEVENLSDWQTLSPDEGDLSSEKGIDYSRLRDLLKAQNFKDADHETYLRMLEAIGKNNSGWIRAEELPNFPDADLKTIDYLWVKYSNGKFGFSVQKKNYIECGGKLDGKFLDDKSWRKFGDRVGWRVNNSWISYLDLTFRNSAPEGHLPTVALWVGCFDKTIKPCTYFLLSHPNL